MHTQPPQPRRVRRLWLTLLLVGLPTLVFAAVQYQQAAARERAAELKAFCATPGTGPFSLKLACIPRRDQ